MATVGVWLTGEKPTGESKTGESLLAYLYYFMILI